MPETSLLPAPYEIAVELDNGDKLPYDLSKVLMIHHHRAARATQFNIPPGICPQKALQERESRINKRIDERMKDLATLSMPDEYRVKAEIELRSLRLSNFQAQIRNEVMHALKRDTTLLTALSPFAYRRTKRQSLREARVTENLERHRKIEAEKKRRQEAADRLQHIMEHARRFREFHRSNANTLDKTKKAIVTYFLNSEREKKKEEERKERERMQKLREEDEEGYRKLLDETKDKRLVHLLEKTDEFIGSLTGLVKAHQATEEKKKKEEEEREKPPKEEGEEDEEDEDGEHSKNGLLAKKEEEEVNDADYYSTAHRIMEKIDEQHKSIGGGDPDLQLKPYQIRGLEWMVSLYNNNLNGILADEMGLGKTIQTIALVTYLMEVKQNMGPYLIIVPLSTISNWQSEFDKWAPHVTFITYKGNKDQRKRLDDKVKRGKYNVLLTTYEYIIKEKAVLGKTNWKYMIIDEGHRLKNDKSQLTTMLNQYFKAQHRLLLTGTPLQNKLTELWALLNFLLPSIFKSCGTFDEWFNAPFETTGEKAELTQEETMLIIRRLHKVLRPFLLRRLKKEVAAELPDKTEHVIKCEMSALQRVLYKHMQRGVLIDGKAKQGSTALNNTMMHLRKLCNHPFLFQSVEESCRVAWNLSDYVGDEIYRVAGKFELLDKILPKLQATGHRTLIFCQMTECMQILADYFEYRSWKYLRLDGSTGHDERKELLSIFNAPNSEYSLFMLSTKAGGLGLNLQTADTVIIFDSDWNPAQDMQAQDRAHRIGQTKEVRVLRLITANSVEEKILTAARHKMNLDGKVIQSGKFNQMSTEAERRRLLEEIISAEVDKTNEADVPGDEAVNMLLARSEDEFNVFQKMDEERKAEEAAKENPMPRLVEESEIPEDITKASETAHKRATDIENGTEYKHEVDRKRKRKAVDYSIGLESDDVWLEKEGLVLDDDDEENGRTPPPRKKKSTSKEKERSRVIIEDDDDE